MAGFNPVQFLNQVKQETAKVVWPSRKETIVSTGMVFVMVFLAALFFFVLDQALHHVVRLVMGIGA